jgi:hypothetical protein
MSKWKKIDLSKVRKLVNTKNKGYVSKGGEFRVGQGGVSTLTSSQGHNEPNWNLCVYYILNNFESAKQRLYLKRRRIQDRSGANKGRMSK